METNVFIYYLLFEWCIVYGAITCSASTVRGCFYPFTYPCFLLVIFLGIMGSWLMEFVMNIFKQMERQKNHEYLKFDKSRGCVNVFFNWKNGRQFVLNFGKILIRRACKLFIMKTESIKSFIFEQFHLFLIFKVKYNEKKKSLSESI